MARTKRPVGQRFRDAGRWFVPVFKDRLFWLSLLGAIVALGSLYLLFNHVLLPMYTRQGVAITVPEVREMSYDDAVRVLERQRLQPERRNQPFNPTLARDAVVDQNPGPDARVKPGRRIYLYVNSGTERSVSMPEVRTLTESRARATLTELGLRQIEIRRDDRPSPYPGTVTNQSPEAGETLRTGESVTLWVSPGFGEGTVEVPDVRGLPYDEAAETLRAAGLWVDPTREITGTVTRQEPLAGIEARRGSEVRLSSAPIEEEPVEEFDDLPFEEPQEGFPPDEVDAEPRDPVRVDW